MDSEQRLQSFLLSNNILVDSEDFAQILDISDTWSLLVRDADTRVIAWVDGRTVYLARVILNCPENLVVDHINGNPLDNRKENLRICTQAENTRNRKPNKGKTTKGITKRPNGKYRARIAAHGVMVNIGDYDTLAQAAEAYNNYALILHANFARLNKDY